MAATLSSKPHHRMVMRSQCAGAALDPPFQKIMIPNKLSLPPASPSQIPTDLRLPNVLEKVSLLAPVWSQQHPSFLGFRSISCTHFACENILYYSSFLLLQKIQIFCEAEILLQVGKIGAVQILNRVYIKFQVQPIGRSRVAAHAAA